MPGRLRFISLITLASLCTAPAALRAEQVLFIGNSYTSGGPDAPLAHHGGIPRLVQAIALSKARKLTFIKLTPGGKDWAYDLKQPVTDAALKARNWDWVVLQDFSTQPTHIGNPGKFFEDGETFYRLIRESCPESKILLYETWAREKGHGIYTGFSTPKTFVDPAQMTAELQRSYTSPLSQARDPRYRKPTGTGPGGLRVCPLPVEISRNQALLDRQASPQRGWRLPRRASPLRLDFSRQPEGRYPRVFRDHARSRSR